MDLFGERLTSVERCYHTPSSGEWAAGEYVDAGLAMVIASNLAHRQRESVRHLAASLGPGAITNEVRGYTYSGTPLDDVTDPGTYSGLTTISWDLQCSKRFGPFYLIADREIADQPPTWRKLRVNVDCTAANLTVLACLTTELDLPSETDHVAFAQSTSSAGRTIVTLDLEPYATLSTTPRTCRRASGVAVEQTPVAACSLWVGWYGVSGSNSVWSIDAYEVR